MANNITTPIPLSRRMTQAYRQCLQKHILVCKYMRRSGTGHNSSLHSSVRCSYIRTDLLLHCGTTRVLPNRQRSQEYIWSLCFGSFKTLSKFPEMENIIIVLWDKFFSMCNHKVFLTSVIQ